MKLERRDARKVAAPSLTLPLKEGEGMAARLRLLGFPKSDKMRILVRFGGGLNRG